MKENNVLIIGGAGFLGKRILHFLAKENCTIYYGDLQTIKGSEKKFLPINVLNNADFNNIDINFSTIINLTGQVTNPSNLCYQLNTTGVANICDFVNKNNSKLIQISTLSVLGSSNKRVNENFPLNPETTYGSLKAASEYIVNTHVNKKDLSILRLSNLYGDNQPKGIMSYLLKSLKNEDEFFFNNDGSLKRHYLNVDDAAKMIVNMCLSFKNGTYNYSGKDKYSIKELIKELENISNKKLTVHYKDVKSWENLENIDTAKITETFEYIPEVFLKKWLTEQL